MLLDKTKLLAHSDLANEEIFEAGWFPKYLEADDKGKAKALRGLEIRIDGLRNDDELFDDATHTLTEAAWRLCKENLYRAYLVLIEDQPLPKSKVRTYKGMFPNKGMIKQGNYIEEEVELDENQSFYMGMAPITEANKDECLSLASYFFRAFILLSSKQEIDIYGRDFLKSIIPCLDVKGTIWINYMKLIPRVCIDGQAVLYFGFHDPCGDYANVRLFFHRDMESLVQKIANLSINHAVE
jgi:hypothetical protein